jgi:acid phosphatase
MTLKLAANSPKSTLDGMPKFVADGNITPDFYAVNTMQPPYQPSANKPLPGGDAAYASPKEPTTLPPQVAQHIGDLLSAKGITWAWYAGAWQATLDGKNVSPVPNFQFHHQPFNYYANMAPGTPRVELVAGTGETPKTHALEAMVDLEVCGAHLHFLALIP